LILEVEGEIRDEIEERGRADSAANDAPKETVERVENHEYLASPLMLDFLSLIQIGQE
jgi:hypothetical protein